MCAGVARRSAAARGAVRCGRPSAMLTRVMMGGSDGLRGPRPTRRAPRRALALFAALAVGVGAAPARADDATLEDGGWLRFTSRTVYQGSQLQLFDDPTRTALRNLNAFAQWLTIGGYGLASGDFDVEVSLRYVTDLGTGFARDTPMGLGIPASDLRDQLQILSAFVDWRNLVPGLLDVRLGRFVQLDDLDWFPLTGLRATLRLGSRKSLMVYAGQPVPYTTFTSASALLYDGLELSDGFHASFGGATQLAFGEDLSLSVSYRHTFVFRDSTLVAGARPGFPEEAALVDQASGGTRGVVEAVVGAGLGYTLRPLHLTLQANGVYNLLFGDLDRGRVALAWTPRPSVHAELEYFRFQPRFAADSIFNYFNIQAWDRVRTAFSFELFGALWLDAGYFLHMTNGTPKGPTTGESVPVGDPLRGGEGLEFRGSTVAHGPRASIEYRHPSFTLGTFTEISTNTGGDAAFGGNYRMFEGYAQVFLFERRLTATTRLNYTGWQTDWVAKADAGLVAPEVKSLGLSVGARGQITDDISVQLDVIRNFERLIQGPYRVLGMVEVRYF